MQQSRALLTPCAALINVDFLVPELPLEFGQSLKIVGGTASLGNWEASTGCTLEWTEGNNWKGSAEVEAGSDVEFKLVKVAGEDWSSWEDGENKVLAVPSTASAVSVVCNWGGDLSIKVSESTPAAATEKPKKSTKPKAAPKKVKEEKKEVKAVAAEPDVAAEPIAVAAEPVAVEPIAAEPIAAEPAVAAAPAFIAVAEKEEAEKEEEKAEEAPVEDPTHSDNGSTGSNGVNLPAEFSSLATKISVGSDGSLIIEFGSSADGVTAASLAAKYIK